MRISENRHRATGRSHIVFDGMDLNDHFEVIGVSGAAHPSIEAVTTEIPGRAGQHYYSRRVGPREVTLRLAAMADEPDPIDVMQRWRELTPLIAGDEPKRLYLDDEMYLNAILTGDLELEFYGDRGAVEVTFTAFDPYFHGREHEVALKAGDNTFRTISRCEVWPVVRVTGATSPLRVRYNATYEEVRVPAVGSLPITIDMEECKTYSGSNYMPVDIQYTDFFSLPANEDVTVWLSGGSGTLTYEERAL